MVMVTRAYYLFDLAAVAHVTPPVVDALPLLDFALLVNGIDACRPASPGKG